MNPLSPPVQAVLELFQGPLASVRFADIDGAGLAQLATEVQAAASALELQESKLTELRQTLAQRQDALLVLAQRALAYARVYAEQDEALTEQLSAIALPRMAKARKPTATATATPTAPADADATESLELAPAEPSAPAVEAPAAEAVTPKTRKIKRGRESSAFSR